MNCFKIIVSFALVFFMLTAFLQPLYAQKKKEKEQDVIYLFKKDWSAAASITEADYFMQVVKENDSMFIARSYNKNGPMLKQESFNDEELTTPNGRFCWYSKKGKLDSTGWVDKGKKDGYWYYYRDTVVYQIIKYNSGKFVSKEDHDAGIFTTADGTSITLAEKAVNDSLERIKDSIARGNVDTVQVEAKYKNGPKAWQDYISKNIQTPDRFMNLMGKGKYTDVIIFMIDKQGNVDKDYYLMKSCEWSADLEVLRIIKESPKWQPARQYGKAVFYRQKQSITFEVN